MASEMDRVLADVVDSRREREAEKFLKENMQPVPGSCEVCMAESDEPHANYCPKFNNPERL